MIIGSEFSDKSKQLLKHIGYLSEGNTDQKLSVKEVNKELEFDRTEIKNFLEYLQELDCIEIITIGGPLLYGHIQITEKGLKKCNATDD